MLAALSLDVVNDPYVLDFRPADLELEGRMKPLEPLFEWLVALRGYVEYLEGDFFPARRAGGLDDGDGGLKLTSTAEQLTESVG